MDIISAAIVLLLVMDPFGNIPLVKQNFTLFIFGIVLISIMPGIVGYLRSRARPS